MGEGYRGLWMYFSSTSSLPLSIRDLNYGHCHPQREETQSSEQKVQTCFAPSGVLKSKMDQPAKVWQTSFGHYQIPVFLIFYSLVYFFFNARILPRTILKDFSFDFLPVCHAHTISLFVSASVWHELFGRLRTGIKRMDIKTVNKSHEV